MNWQPPPSPVIELCISATPSQGGWRLPHTSSIDGCPSRGINHMVVVSGQWPESAFDHRIPALGILADPGRSRLRTPRHHQPACGSIHIIVWFGEASSCYVSWRVPSKTTIHLTEKLSSEMDLDLLWAPGDPRHHLALPQAGERWTRSWDAVQNLEPPDSKQA